jgi:hypothetical protein
MRSTGLGKSATAMHSKSGLSNFVKKVPAMQNKSGQSKFVKKKPAMQNKSGPPKFVKKKPAMQNKSGPPKFVKKTPASKDAVKDKDGGKPRASNYYKVGARKRSWSANREKEFVKVMKEIWHHISDDGGFMDTVCRFAWRMAHSGDSEDATRAKVREVVRTASCS